MRTISRLYEDHRTGERVVAELERAGIPHSDISIIANNNTGWFDREKRTPTVDRDRDGVDDRAEGAAVGAGIGATVGGLAGLLAGLGLLAIPGIGPVVAAGWLASTAAVAVAGGATGGLIGALTQSGISENDARAYAEGVRRGGTLVSVRVADQRAVEVEAIMDRFHPTQIGSSPARREAGWAGDRIVAVFANADQARAAREALIGENIDNGRMEILEHRSDLDNWTAIKRHTVPDDDTHLYAECLGRGQAILVIQVPQGEHQRVVRALARLQPIDIDDQAAQWRKTGWSGVHPGKAAWEAQRQTVARGAGSQEQVIPVYEEELKVGKRVVEQGHIRVRVYTVEHPVQEGLTLREERVAVERRPVDRPVSGARPDMFRERTVDVTTHREEPVVGKEARVKEEIVVRKDADQRNETVRDTVRRTEVEVQDDREKTGTRTPSKP